MKCLVLGSNGFIASHLIPKLKELGYTVLEFDRGSKFPKNKVDVVFHLAGNSSLRPIVKNPELAKENYDITSDVLEWMRKTKTKKIIFASSREVYSMTNMYAVSKKLSEETIEAYAKMYGIEYVILRMTNLYGKGDHEDRFIPTAIRLARQNKDIPIIGRDKLLNFVYIEDCIDTLVKVMNFKGTYDLNDPESVTLKLVAQIIISLLNSKSKIIIKPLREGETREYKSRPSPFELKYVLREGLQKTI